VMTMDATMVTTSKATQLIIPTTMPLILPRARPRLSPAATLPRAATRNSSQAIQCGSAVDRKYRES
jgi:hypothetical protein